MSRCSQAIETWSIWVCVFSRLRKFHGFSIHLLNVHHNQGTWLESPQAHSLNVSHDIAIFLKEAYLFYLASERKKTRQEGALVSMLLSCSRRAAVLYPPTCYTGLLCLFTSVVETYLCIHHCKPCL